MKLIKLPSIFIAIVTITFILPSCEDYLPGISGEGDLLETIIYLEDFEKIANTTDADVILSQGDIQEVKIIAQKNILDNLNKDIRSGRWTIEDDKRVRQSKKVTIFITMPDIEKIQISGSGDFTTEEYFDDIRDLEIDISGSGEVDFEGDIRDLEATLSGNGDLELSGEAETFDLEVSGSGNTYASSFNVERAEIEISGSGFAKVNVEDYLNASISGSGNVYYKGNPEIKTHITGSGKLVDDN